LLSSNTNFSLFNFATLLERARLVLEDAMGYAPKNWKGARHTKHTKQY
jgi:hypothetical protein